MKYDTQPPSFEELAEKTKLYAETHINLLKLKFIETTSSIASSTISFVAIGLFAFIVFILLSIGVALWLGKLLGAYHYGFFITAGIFLILITLLYVFKDKWLKNPIANSLINVMHK